MHANKFVSPNDPRLPKINYFFQTNFPKEIKNLLKKEATLTNTCKNQQNRLIIAITYQFDKIIQLNINFIIGFSWSKRRNYFIF